MPSETVIAVAGSVTALTQLLKFWGLPDRYGAAIVMGLSLLGVVIWGASQPEPFNRLQLWQYFAAVVNCMVSAAGVYGFARATSAREITSTGRAAPLEGRAEPRAG
jgi:glucose dehydrogenase